MFIEDKLKRIYLNYKIKEIIPFPIKPAQKKTESAVILKRYLKKDCGHGYISMFSGMTDTKTISGTAFEALIHKIIPDNFDTKAVGIMIRQKISFGIIPVKRLKNRLSNSIGLNTSYNRALKKLVLSILLTIDQPVFNLKKTARDLC